jgi:hypothetical protein
MPLSVLLLSYTCNIEHPLVFKCLLSYAFLRGDRHSVSHIDRGGEPLQSNMAVPPVLTLVLSYAFLITIVLL